MKNTLEKFAKLGSLAALSFLTACGGGGSATGGLTAFSVVPSSWTVTALKGDTTCNEVGGSEITVTIVGGTPPYRIVNSKPTKFVVSDTVLDGKNPTFTVMTLGGCSTDLPILILDNQSRSTSLTVTVEAGEEDTTATTTP